MRNPWPLIVAFVSLTCLAMGCGDTSAKTNGPRDTGTPPPGDVLVGDTGGQDDTKDVSNGDTGATPDDTQVTSDTSQDTTVAPDLGPSVTGAHIEPTTVNVTTQLGVPATRQLDLFLDYADGTSEAVDAGVLWSVDEPLIGDIDTNGLLTVTGDLGGALVVTARYAGFQEERVINVRLSSVSLAGTIDATGQAAIDAGSFDVGGQPPTWEYPENETMFPAGTQPPLIQWARNANTVFKLTLSRGMDVTFTVYTDLNEYQPSEAEWRALAAGYGEPILLDVYGKTSLDAAAPKYAAETRTVFTADANLSGSVYYWQIETGDIMRIDDGATAPVPVFTTNANTGNCRGCHTLSRDGSRLAFMYNGGGDPRAGLAWTSAPEPPIIDNFSPYQWDFMAFNPSGSRLAAVYYGAMSLWDTTPNIATGTSKLLDVPSANLNGWFSTQPNWSPDGSTIAYVVRADGVDWSYNQAHLALIDWDPATETLTNPRILAQGGPIGGTDDSYSYPSWSPDSQWIATGVGPTNRDPTNMKIHLVDPLTGNGTHMQRGNPGGLDVFPSFSPFIEGGYYWLLFYSMRPYGHVTTHKQLWVMAIDQNTVNGVDGSHPAFWLPGQDTTKQNITGYWAPAPCHGAGQECSAGSECCSGLSCAPDANGVNVCQAGSECALLGDPCATNADCCETVPPLICLPSLSGVNVCQPEPN